MFELKQLSREAIPTALDKALRYRLLEEPNEAESICQDILSIEPDNQQALVVLLLALTFCPGSTTSTNALTMPALSVSARPRRGCSRAIPAPATMLTNSLAKR